MTSSSLRILLALLSFLVLPGCALTGETSGLELANQRAGALEPREIGPPAVFDKAQTERAMRPGTARIDGVLYTSRGRYAWVKKLQNDKTFHPGTEVLLMPDTDYVRSYIAARREHHGSPVQVAIDPAFRPLIRRAVTDAYGRFSFDSLQPGRYVLISEVFMRNGYTVDEVVGQGQGPLGSTTYTQQRRVDTSYTKILDASIDVTVGAQVATVEVNDH